MSTDSRAFEDLAAAWRRSDWKASVALLRPIVEAVPEVLSTRLLLAAFAAEAKNPGLALLHFEKLMVQAVGQGELLHALAAERGLTALGRDENAHRKRVQALQQWFRTLPSRRRAGRTALPAGWLLELSAAEFRRHAESCRVLALRPDPAAFENPGALFAVLLHGAGDWVYHPAGEAPLPRVRAGTGDAIAGPAGCEPGDHLVIEAAEPSVLLVFDGAVAEGFRRRCAVRREPSRVAPPARPPAPREAPPRPPAVETPAVADAAPERRAEHELVIHLADGRAELGLAGTRTGPIAGRLADLSPSGLSFLVPRAMVRQSRGALEGAHVVAQVAIQGDDEPLRLAGRITGIAFETAGSPPRAQLTMEFVLLLAPDRARLQEALIAGTRCGGWRWDEGAAVRPAA